MKKIAIVTGGSSGIGHAIAKKLYGEGYLVALTSRCENRAKKIAAAIGSTKDVIGVQYNAGELNMQHAQEVLEKVNQELGPVTALVNAAGESYDMLLLRMKEEKLHELIQTNLMGPLAMCKAVTKGMLKQRHGM